MVPALTLAAFLFAVLSYGVASVWFFLEIVRNPAQERAPAAKAPPETRQRWLTAPRVLAVAAVAHATHITMASFVAKVCPVRSVHFFLSVAALLAVAIYLPARRRFRVEAMGLVVAPLGLAFTIGTFLLGRPEPEGPASPAFVSMHVLANLLGVALFLLAGAAAALYLVQDRRIKQKRRTGLGKGLGALETLDRAVHNFLLAGFPLLTLGIVTGTYWARKLESGSPDDVWRTVFGYATWLQIAAVLLLRAALGWRGRRAAYGTIIGLACALVVLAIYVVRPSGGHEPQHGATPVKDGNHFGSPEVDA